MAKDWKIELIRAHARLFLPPKRHLDEVRGYPECNEGWRNLLERACSRIETSLGRHHLRVVQIKEKYGTLRFYWDGKLPEKVEIEVAEAIALAEAQSACTCEICGAKGRLYSRGGWLATACTQHARGEAVPIKPGFENLRIARRILEGQVQIISCRRYDRAGDTFVDVDPKSLGIEE